MSAYAPPSHPPPEQSSSPSGPSSSRYAPTTTPTPGQALLRNGRMLVYPHGWRGCAKCRDTGYKQGDPTHPCRKCWQDYGQPFNPLLISTAGLQGAKVLQKPLPASMSTGVGGMPGTYGPLTSTHNTGHAGFPGAMMAQQPTGHPSYYTSNPFASPQQTFSPPAQPPPPAVAHAVAPQPPPRRNPVNRTQDSREDDLNENGEAPPAYEDAVAAGPDGALPPQRAEEQENSAQGGRQQSDAPSQQRPTQSPQPPPTTTTTQQPPYVQPYGQHYQQPPHAGPWGMPPGGAQMMPYGHRPPPHALVVRPGDPRIGGRLCYKCGGDGIREDFWFGMHETCRVCNGSGRIL